MTLHKHFFIFSSDYLPEAEKRFVYEVTLERIVPLPNAQTDASSSCQILFFDDPFSSTSYSRTNKIIIKMGRDIDNIQRKKFSPAKLFTF